jgi:hypothetical protein
MKAPSFVLGEYRMSKAVLVIAAGLALAGCGTQMGDRMASGAAIGGSAGLVAGGVGVIPRALVGAAVGGLTSPEQVNLGEPVWDEDEGDDTE